MATRTKALGVGIAAVNLVVFILAFTSIYPFPAGDFKVDLPSPNDIEWSYSAGEVTVTAPFSVDNGGYYSVDELQLRYEVTNYSNVQIAEDTIALGSMKAGTVTAGEIVFTFDLAEMYNDGIAWMIFNDDLLEFVVEVSCYYTMKLVKFDARYSVSIPWDALIQDFSVDEPWIDPADPGTLLINYSLTTSDLLPGFATLDAELLEDGSVVAEFTEAIALGGTSTGTIELELPLYSIPDSWRLEIGIPGIPEVMTYEGSVDGIELPEVIP